MFCDFADLLQLSEIMDTKLFSMEEAALAPGWLKEIRGEHVPETEEYNVSSFVFRAQRPFHARRLHDLLKGVASADAEDLSKPPSKDDHPLSHVIRSKGFFWLATANDQIGLWSQAGSTLQVEPCGRWWCVTPREEWPEELDAEVRASLESRYGDRKTELVMIGIFLPKERVQAALESCLLTDEEMEAGPEAWSTWEDPVWNHLDSDEDEDEGDDDDGQEIDDETMGDGANEAGEEVMESS